MASMYTDSYCLGGTVGAVGLSAPLVFNPAANVNGVWFKYQSGGSLFIGNGLSQIPGSNMYLVGTEVISAGGPARFFLYATGATAVVSIGVSYSRGLSAPIAGG